MKLKFSFALLIIPLLLSLQACPVNPLKTAQTLEQKVDALYGQYVIAKEQGAEILKNPTLPDTAKRPVAQAMVRSKTMGDAGHNLLLEYSAARAELAGGATSGARLLIAQQNMDKWLVDAAPVINQLISAVGAIWK